MRWQVKFCEQCFGAFDAPILSRSDLCEDCRAENHRRMTREWRARTSRIPRTLLSAEERREHARTRKARWRAASGQH